MFSIQIYYFHYAGIQTYSIATQLQLLNLIRPYYVKRDAFDKRGEHGKLELKQQIQYVTHLIYLFSDYGIHYLPKNIFLPEYTYLEEFLDLVRSRLLDSDLLGECIHCLVILGWNSPYGVYDHYNGSSIKHSNSTNGKTCSTNNDIKKLLHEKIMDARKYIIKDEQKCGKKGYTNEKPVNCSEEIPDYHSTFSLIVSLTKLDLKILPSFDLSRVFRMCEEE